MEAWATVVIVLVSNAIIGAVSVLIARKQLKHLREQLMMQLDAQKDADKHERQREVRSEPLLKLRTELARMAAKGERVVYLAKSIMWQAYWDSESPSWRDEGKMPNALRYALSDWEGYMGSGELQQVLFMQFDVNLVERVLKVRDEYNRASTVMSATPWVNWMDEDAKVKESEALGERIRDNVDVIIRNRDRIGELQSEINRRLEEL